LSEGRFEGTGSNLEVKIKLRDHGWKSGSELSDSGISQTGSKRNHQM